MCPHSLHTMSLLHTGNTKSNCERNENSKFKDTSSYLDTVDLRGLNSLNALENIVIDKKNFEIDLLHIVYCRNALHICFDVYLQYILYLKPFMLSYNCKYIPVLTVKTKAKVLFI